MAGRKHMTVVGVTRIRGLDGTGLIVKRFADGTVDVAPTCRMGRTFASLSEDGMRRLIEALGPHPEDDHA